MASNKSQLDVYKLDIPTVVNEMHDSMTEEEKAEFVELEKAFLASKTDMSESAADFVRKLIDYRKDPPQPYNTQKVAGNVWDFSRVRFKMEEYENHPTQKPEALLERIIKASSNEGDIVFDPFSGSFTTSAIAVRLGRIAIGIDMNDEYYEIGIRRTGIATEYMGKQLIKEKIRKTNAKSKYVRK